MKSLQKDAYAKINLFLDIDSKRDDGYHNIISVMQGVSLCDTVTVEYTESEQKVIKICCDNPEIPLGEKNIAYKAAELFLNSGEVQIHIEKRIPAAAGLAGGSTDAAAVLTLLNEFTGNKKSTDELLSIGAKIGADVPFCISGGTKLALGIGEKLTDFKPIPSCYIVISKMGDGVSTPKAYSMLDDMFDNFTNYQPNKELLALLEKGSCYNGMFNVFESVVIPERPAVQKIKDTMLKYGAEFSMMSGSGPSVFGIFLSEEKATDARNALVDMGAVAHLCEPV